MRDFLEVVLIPLTFMAIGFAIGLLLNAEFKVF